MDTKDSATGSSTIYSTKWGRVTILQGDNFPQFKSTVKPTLHHADALSIVMGTELRPASAIVPGPSTRASSSQPQTSSDIADTQRKWDERLLRGLMILYNGVSSSIQLSIQTLHDNDDITGIWNELSKYDRSTDPNYCQKLQEVFWEKSFDPTKQSIQHYLQELLQIKYQLPTIFNDNQVLMKLYASLPKDSIWEQARLFMVQNKFTL